MQVFFTIHRILCFRKLSGTESEVLTKNMSEVVLAIVQVGT